MSDREPELSRLLAGFGRGMGFGALGGLLIYAVVLLRERPVEAAQGLGLAAGMLAAMVGGAFLGGLVSAYLRLLRRPKD